MTMPTAETSAAPSPANTTPAELLYPDLAQEFAATRRMLERVPDGQLDWRPHPKSMTLGRLATHLAELPRLAATVITTDDLDFAASGYTPTTLATTAEMVAAFDEHAAGMRAVLADADWAALGKRWTMRAGDTVFVDDQKGKLIRTFGISHMAHHRAQLGVYLRLLDQPVPGMYGPSADER